MQVGCSVCACSAGAGPAGRTRSKQHLRTSVGLGRCAVRERVGRGPSLGAEKPYYHNMHSIRNEGAFSRATTTIYFVKNKNILY